MCIINENQLPAYKLRNIVLQPVRFCTDLFPCTYSSELSLCLHLYYQSDCWWYSTSNSMTNEKHRAIWAQKEGVENNSNKIEPSQNTIKWKKHRNKERYWSNDLLESDEICSRFFAPINRSGWADGLKPSFERVQKITETTVIVFLRLVVSRRNGNQRTKTDLRESLAIYHSSATAMINRSLRFNFDQDFRVENQRTSVNQDFFEFQFT